MDNIYWVNNPMTEYEEGTVVNPEMLKNPKFGGTIKRKKGYSGQPIMPVNIPFVGDKLLVGLAHWDEVAEKRTGVSRSTMALDPEALQNQSATANQNQRDASYSQIELIARNQAELGWKRVFQQILKLAIKHQDRPRTIRLRDEWVEVDPRPWNANMDAVVNVGLGTGSRERDIAMLSGVQRTQLELTDRFAGAGLKEEAVDMIPKVVSSAKKIAESAGLRNPDDFYPDIGEEELTAIKQKMAEQAGQPPPEMQMEKAKMDMDVQLEQVRAERQRQTEQAQMEADLHVKDREFENDMRKFAAQQDLERDKMRQHYDIEMQKLELQREKIVASLAPRVQAGNAA
jgi:enamine deaminase RidA (YjgF/YER057c/UK114 family)